MIRVSLLTPLPVVYAGLKAVIAGEAGMEVVGERPDVVVLDVHNSARGALARCRRISRSSNAPGVVLYAEATAEDVLVAASLAGAGAVVPKDAPPATLVDAIRRLAASPRGRPRVSLRIQRDAALRVDPRDHPILAMSLAGESAAAIGETLGIPPRAVSGRIAAIIAGLSRVAVDDRLVQRGLVGAGRRGW